MPTCRITSNAQRADLSYYYGYSIYAHGTVTARLEGECSRCLDPVEQDVTARLDELFLYPEKVKADELEDSVLLEGDEVRLSPRKAPPKFPTREISRAR